jgi:hypothetical protein
MKTFGIKTIVAAIAAISSVSASAAITTLDGKGFDLSFNSAVVSPSLLSLSADRTSVVFDTEAFHVDVEKGDADFSSLNALLTISLDSGYKFTGLELTQSGLYSLIKKNSEVSAALISSAWIQGKPASVKTDVALFDKTDLAIGGGSYALANTYNLAGTAFENAPSFKFFALSGLSADAANKGAASIFANAYSLQVMTAPVPEPEQWALMLAGIGMVGAIARRRSRRA